MKNLKPTFKDSYSGAPAHASVSGIEVKYIWNVSAKPSYHPIRMIPEETSLIAVRCHDGNGCIKFFDGTTFHTNPNHLIILENHRIHEYFCSKERWDFWWIKFLSSGPVQCPLHKLLTVRSYSREAEDFSSLFKNIRSPHASKRIFASAVFLKMLTQWLSDYHDSAIQPLHQHTIERIIDLMYEKVGNNWTVTEMAREARMSERAFRNAFLKITGRAPKTFYDRIRIDTGAQHLKLGIQNVSEIADKLNFSSPFHFSKLFRKHYGSPPSKLIS